MSGPDKSSFQNEHNMTIFVGPIPRRVSVVKVEPSYKAIRLILFHKTY
jgi:hypothetical protein